MFNVGVSAQQSALRNLRCSHTLAFCAVVLYQHWMWGGEGVLGRSCYMSDCMNAFCELFSINSHLTHGRALHCAMSARQICVPGQHKTRCLWIRSLFVFYVLMLEHTLFSRRGCTTQRKADLLLNVRSHGCYTNVPLLCQAASLFHWFHSKSRLIPLIPLILISIPLKKLTNPTNPTNPDF